MARITFVTSICDAFTGGQDEIELAGDTVFKLVRMLDERFPGLGKFVETRASIAVEGVVIHDWTQALADGSEVLVFPRIAGGQSAASSSPAFETKRGENPPRFP